jgi:sugar (pentulose or hexulose) kinase
MLKDLILAIDSGTQSMKALVFTPTGDLIAKQIVAMAPYDSKQPGWVEAGPEVFWQALCQACHGLWHPGGVEKARIAGMALTTQRGSVINLDKSGKPLRPAILWPDQRKTSGMRPLGGLWGMLFRVSGLSRTVAYLQSEAEANWIATHQPELWRRTDKFLLLSGYLTYRLTGRFIDSVGCQVGYLPFDFKKQRWASKRNWKWQLLPINRRQLPELVPPGQRLGEVSAEAASATGLPRGLPVIAAAADKACEVIGSGSLDPSIGCLSFGTTATINVTHKKYVEAIRLLPAYPSAVPNCYTLEVQVYRGYWMVSWFKEEFGQPEQLTARQYGKTPEELFETLAENTPPGSMGLILQPFWTPGLRNPGPEAKGAIIGFGDVHTRSHLYRAILEGLAYALREGKERIEKRTHIPITSLRVSGGGSQSPSAMQLTADIFGLAVAKPHLHETSGLGAGINAAVALGLHPDVTAAVAAMTRLGTVFEPDPANHRRYDALYRDVYRQMYRRLKPLYRRIREITGYPA